MGPSLENLFGRTAGTVEGYRYSKAMRKSGIVWNEETLKKFLKKPRKYIRGTRMRFSGIRKESQLDGLIAYLKLKLGLEATNRDASEQLRRIAESNGQEYKDLRSSFRTYYFSGGTTEKEPYPEKPKGYVFHKLQK